MDKVDCCGVLESTTGLPIIPSSSEGREVDRRREGDPTYGLLPSDEDHGEIERRGGFVNPGGLPSSPRDRQVVGRCEKTEMPPGLLSRDEEHGHLVPLNEFVIMNGLPSSPQGSEIGLGDAFEAANSLLPCGEDAQRPAGER